MAEIYRAKEAFAYTDLDGVNRVVTPGLLMSGDDPNFEGKESLFERVELAAQHEADRPKGKPAETAAPPAHPTSETASADPNSKRSLTHPKPAVTGGK